MSRLKNHLAEKLRRGKTGIITKGNPTKKLYFGFSCERVSDNPLKIKMTVYAFAEKRKWHGIFPVNSVMAIEFKDRNILKLDGGFRYDVITVFDLTKWQRQDNPQAKLEIGYSMCEDFTEDRIDSPLITRLDFGGCSVCEYFEHKNEILWGTWEVNKTGYNNVSVLSNGERNVLVFHN